MRFLVTVTLAIILAVSGPARALGPGLGVGLSHKGPAAAPFTPAALPGLVLWLRADLGVTTGSTFTWADQSGQGNSFTQSTSAAQPTTSTNAVNNQSAVVFGTGATSSYLTANSHLLTSVSGATVAERIIVVQFNTATNASGGRAYIGNDWLAGGNDSGDIYSNSTAGNFDGFFRSNIESAACPTIAANTPIAYDVQSSSAGLQTFFNATAAINTTAGSFGVLTVAPMLGYNGNTNLTIADVAEVILCTQILTGGSRASLKTYLQARYGNTVNI